MSIPRDIWMTTRLPRSSGRISAWARISELRTLEMKCGRVERSWVRNCLAVGLAQGFLEPLEATALHILLATVELIYQRLGRQMIEARSMRPLRAATKAFATISSVIIAQPCGAIPIIGAMPRQLPRFRTV